MDNSTVDELQHILSVVKDLVLEFDRKDALLVNMFKMTPSNASDAILSTLKDWSAATILSREEDSFSYCELPSSVCCS